MADEDDATLDISTLNWLLFFRGECAPQLRRRAKCGEEVTCDKYSRDLHCAVIRGKRHHTYIVCGQTGKAPRLLAPRQKIGVRHRSLRDALAYVVLPELDETVRFRIRQWT